MIFNPTRRGGAEKEYTITNDTSYSWPATAKAGAVASFFQMIGSAPKFVVKGEDDTIIPTAEGTPASGKGHIYYFIMPAQNVTISKT